MDPMEKLHLSLLKWTLGVKRKTTNIPIWGDTGRHPIAISMVKLLIDFHNRLAMLNDNNSPLIVRHAFVEQITLNLPWFKMVNELCSKLDPNAQKHCRRDGASPKPNSLLIKNRLEEWFEKTWDRARLTYSKLSFYNQVKHNFAPEPFLHLKNHKKAKCIAWLRTSSHRLNVETGRYGNKINSIHHRARDFCCTQDRSVLELLVNLPNSEVIMEDEVHFLRDCGNYEDLRAEQSPRMYSILQSDISALFDQHLLLLESSNYIYKLFKRRFQ